MQIKLEFPSPVDGRTVVKYITWSTFLSEEIKSLFNKDSMKIIPVKVTADFGEGYTTTTIFVSTLVEKSGYKVSINQKEKEEVPEVAEDIYVEEPIIAITFKQKFKKFWKEMWWWYE